jgi:hypothetical protein
VSGPKRVADRPDVLDDLHRALHEDAQFGVIAEIRSRLALQHRVSRIDQLGKVAGRGRDLTALDNYDPCDRFGEFLCSPQYQGSISAVQGFLEAVAVALDRCPTLRIDPHWPVQVQVIGHRQSHCVGWRWSVPRRGSGAVLRASRNVGRAEPVHTGHDGWSREAIDLVLHAQSVAARGKQTALANEDGAIDPVVALIAGCEGPRGANRLVGEFCRGERFDGTRKDVGRFDEALVCHVNQRSAIRLHHHAHIDSGAPVISWRNRSVPG